MTLRVTTRITGIGGGPGFSRQHFGFVNNESQEDAQFAADAVFDMWDAMKGALYVGCTYEIEPEVQVVNPATGQVTGAFIISQVPVVGTSSDNPLPWTTQGLLQLRTGVYSGGREARGRVFVPGVTEAVNDLGRPNGVGLDILNAGGTALQGAGAYLPVVLSKGQALEVTSTSAWSQWAYLGSRRD